MNEMPFAINLLSPALFLSVLLSAGHASLYHLWGGRSLGDLVRYCIIAGIGFAAGQFSGGVLWAGDPLQIGQVHVVTASVGAWVALLGMDSLSGRIRAAAPQRR
jgi:hypothetical protein